MKYKLLNPMLLKSKDGSYNGRAIKGGHYVVATLQMSNGRVNGNYMTSDAIEVALFEQYLAEAQQEGVDQFGRPKFKPSMLLDATNPLPDYLTTIPNGKWETVELPGNEPYVHVRQNADGSLVPVLKNGGGYSLIRSVRVFTQKDEDGEYLYHWSPDERMSTMIGRTIAPISMVQLPQAGGSILNQQGLQEMVEPIQNVADGGTVVTPPQP